MCEVLMQMFLLIGTNFNFLQRFVCVCVCVCIILDIYGSMHITIKIIIQFYPCSIPNDTCTYYGDEEYEESPPSTNSNQSSSCQVFTNHSICLNGPPMRKIKGFSSRRGKSSKLEHLITNESSQQMLIHSKYPTRMCKYPCRNKHFPHDKDVCGPQ